jgi:hypothetical protein
MPCHCEGKRSNIRGHFWCFACLVGKCSCKEDCIKTGQCTCDSSCQCNQASEFIDQIYFDFTILFCNNLDKGCGKDGCKCEDCKCPTGTCKCEKWISTTDYRRTFISNHLFIFMLY